MNLKDKNILLGVTGGIGAYKAIELTRLLVKSGATVWPVMTDSAMEFIGALSLETLSGNPVSSSLFKPNDTGRINHIELAEKADLVIIAPATANTIGKIAGGIADDILSTLVLATTAQILIAPAMNNHMYENKAVQANIEKLQGFGYSFVGPAEGELACGTEGRGRLAPVEEILEKAKELLSPKDLKGITVLVTAGATREAVDPIRFLSNGSSGKMGFSLARAALRRGAKVILISGNTTLTPPPGVTFIEAISAEDMHRETLANFIKSSIVIMAAAVSDYTPKEKLTRKLKKSDANLTIEMTRTKDILKEMGENKGERILVGFALETDSILENARGKLTNKNLDMVIANSAEALASRTNQATILYRERATESLPKLDKDSVAELIIERVAGLKSGKIKEKPVKVAQPIAFNKRN